MNRTFGGPLAFSVAGHCATLALLAAFAGHLPRPPPPLPAPRAIEIMLPPPMPPAPVEPKPPPPPVPAVEEPPPEPKPPPIVKEKPPPPPRIVKEKPPPPLPRSRPVVTMRPPPEIRREPPVQYAAPAPPPQTAPIPRPPPPAAPVVSSAYRNELYAWIQGHKYYPESARERGEAGAGVLRFRVDRAGRVLNYTVVRSTGYPDLDAAINRMMQGAQMPAFPADMTASNVEVSVTIRFALAQ